MNENSIQMNNEYSEPVNFIDLVTQQGQIRTKIEEAIQGVLNHGQYIMGPEVKTFETALQTFTGCQHALTCANGTDALTLVLMAWDIGYGDAVFVPSFTYVASAEAPALLGATPFFVDVCQDTFNLDVDSFKQAIMDCRELGLRPAVVIPVDLFGQPADVDEISSIAAEEKIKVLIDAAQSFGGISKGRRVGTMGDATTTSFFPAKPLGCYGDGGAIFTDNEECASIIQSLRLHGKGIEKYDNVRIGMNSRLDTIQAAILIEKLSIFPNEIKMRQKVADTYIDFLADTYRVPVVKKDITSAWAQFTLQVANREETIKKLSRRNVPSGIYYPKALSEQSGYSKFPRVSSGVEVSELLSKNVLSLPMHPYLSEDDQVSIVDALK